MKLSFALVACTLATATKHHRARREDGEREGAKRYSQLIDQMSNYNPDFDERKYWTYGCHCLMLGDRPMSEMGHGAPKDALDSVCRAYKECQKCARDVHGETCIGEFHRYANTIANGDSQCNDSPGTCTRALCECDKRFAMDHVGVTGVFTNDYHRFYSNPQFLAEEHCVPNGGGATDPQCCSNADQSAPFILYNALRKDCCTDGTVASTGSC